MSLQKQKHFTFHHLTETHLSRRNTNLLNRIHAIVKTYMATHIKRGQRCTHSIHPFFVFHTFHCSITKGSSRNKPYPWMQGRVYWWIKRSWSRYSSTALGKIIKNTWRCRTSEDKPCSTEISLAQLCNTNHKKPPKTAPRSPGNALHCFHTHPWNKPSWKSWGISDQRYTFFL